MNFITRLLDALIPPRRPILRSNPAKIEAEIPQIQAHLSHSLRLRLVDQPRMSWIGGAPQMSPDRPWPSFDDKPMSFLAQLDCGELRQAGGPEWLPVTGRLLFFFTSGEPTFGASYSDKGSWAVIHETAAVEAIRPLPDDLPEKVKRRRTRWAAHPVMFEREVSAPDSPRWETAISHGDYSDAVQVVAPDFYATLDDDNHKVGGYPNPVQTDDIELTCEIASNGGSSLSTAPEMSAAAWSRASDWKLLFQLSSDDAVDMNWVDGGSLYFCIRESDARTGDFSKVWMVMQFC